MVFPNLLFPLKTSQTLCHPPTPPLLLQQDGEENGRHKKVNPVLAGTRKTPQNQLLQINKFFKKLKENIERS